MSNDLQQLIASKMGRDPYLLFTTDDDFKNAKNLDDISDILKKRSSGSINADGASIRKMINFWVISNKCQPNTFSELLKVDEELKKRKGAASFREIFEDFYKKNMWEVISQKFDQCESLSQAVAFITRNTEQKIKVSEQTLAKTIEAALENNEFAPNVFWAKWLPKKRHRKTEEEEVEEKKSNYINVLAKTKCNKCDATGTRTISIFNKHCVIGLRAIRCQKCESWGTLVFDFNVYEKELKIGPIDIEGSVSETFLDKNMKPIRNPFLKNE